MIFKVLYRRIIFEVKLPLARPAPKKIPCTRVQGINYFALLRQAPTLQS